MPDKTGDIAGPRRLPSRHTFGHVTVRFLGAAMPALTLGLALAFIMS